MLLLYLNELNWWQLGSGNVFDIFWTYFGKNSTHMWVIFNKVFLSPISQIGGFWYLRLQGWMNEFVLTKTLYFKSLITATILLKSGLNQFRMVVSWKLWKAICKITNDWYLYQRITSLEASLLTGNNVNYCARKSWRYYNKLAFKWRPKSLFRLSNYCFDVKYNNNNNNNHFILPN